MASIGRIYLGGRKAHGPSEVVNGAVAFRLEKTAPRDLIYHSEDKTWSVEIVLGQESIVARTSDTLSRDDVIRIGFEQVQRAIDILTFESHLHLAISKPGSFHIILFTRNGDLILQHVDGSKYEIGGRSIIEVGRKGEKSVPLPEPPHSIWYPPLRYYRLSQTANDLYEAYRNLFLALESLLNMEKICPIKKDKKGKNEEGEKQWLRRSLEMIRARINIEQFVPPEGTADPVEYFITDQYENIRCRLFHAKGELPATYEGTVNPEKVALAYKRLLSLWREIAIKYLSVKIQGFDYTPDEGLQIIMEHALPRDLSVFYTEDASFPNKADTDISPLGKDVYPFSDFCYLSKTSPCHVSFLSTQRFNSSRIPTMVHRICSKSGKTLMSVSYIRDGLMPDDIDVFESLQTICFVNAQQPRPSFDASIPG
jgi:hypothetical protein